VFNPETRAWEAGDNAPGHGRDRGDAGQLYNLPEHEVSPMYYTLSEIGIPHMWVEKIKKRPYEAPHRSFPPAGW